KYCVWKGYTQAQLPVITQDYYDDNTGKSPRYYQLQAINKTIEERIDIEKLVVITGYSRRSLQDFFKEKCGVSIGKYIRQRKL
ncbi:hypothetical protein MJM59_33620, partial [Salmonella enterica subsp. enterica serovar Montevideo]|nr:hypothetical protein [Salmonella enterica subsp. enterica serovar Montevideo]